MRACGNEYENELETGQGMGIIFGGWSRLCRVRTVHCWPLSQGVFNSTSHVPMLGKPYFGYSIMRTSNLALGVERWRE
jgi:hypothetical protein